MSITNTRLPDDMAHSLEESRWQETLEALESIKAGKSLDEAEVNAWLNGWGITNRTSPPKL